MWLDGNDVSFGVLTSKNMSWFILHGRFRLTKCFNKNSPKNDATPNPTGIRIPYILYFFVHKKIKVNKSQTAPPLPNAVILGIKKSRRLQCVFSFIQLRIRQSIFSLVVSILSFAVIFSNNIVNFSLLQVCVNKKELFFVLINVELRFLQNSKREEPYMNLLSLQEKECIRRISIGLNDHLSLEERKILIENGEDLACLERTIKGFKPHCKEAYEIISWLESDSFNFYIEYGEQEYPSFDGLSRHLPFFLLGRGTLPSLENKYIGIIGTRVPDYDALHKGFMFGLETAAENMTVISGFAEGIDQAAMRGALSFGGSCVGVLACGHDVEYPLLTYRLREKIIEKDGCVLSRFHPSCPSYKSNFVSRNMIIAAYSSALIVVQAPEKSGTLITCDYALSMGKDVYVAKEGIGNSYKRHGSSNLFYDGAPVLSSLSDASFDTPFKALARCCNDTNYCTATGYCNDKTCYNGVGKAAKFDQFEFGPFRFGDKLYIVDIVDK